MDSCRYLEGRANILRPEQEVQFFPDTKISITEKGKEALYDHLNREKIERKISIRYWITTGISLVALAVAIISIVLQFQ